MTPRSPGPVVTRLRRALAIARVGEDPEGVHQARVAARRLRVWLALAGHTALDGDLRWLAQGLGAVRDFDVLSAGPLGEAGALAEWMRRRAAAARDQANEVLAATRVAALVRALEALPPPSPERLEAGLRRRERELDEARRRWRRSARHGLEAELEATHALRRALRRVRYAREWAGEAGLALVAPQDALGALCDLAALSRLLDQVALESPSLDVGPAHAQVKAGLQTMVVELQGTLDGALDAALASRAEVERG